VVHDNLQFLEVCARWVPKELTDERKCMRVDVCCCHLTRYREEGDNFLQRIVTGDETWVHYCQLETKWKSMQWKQPSSPVAKKFKMQPSAGRLMLTIFWDFQGPILETYLERGTTVISDMLQRGLKPAVCSKKEGHCQRPSCCCMTMPVPILQPTHWKP
jgi:histone-lysine N-methyltransferase SETMAR